MSRDESSIPDPVVVEAVLDSTGVLYSEAEEEVTRGSELV